MPQPALTIVSLIRSPALAESCIQGLKGGRYRLVPLDPADDPVRELEGRREEFDALLLEEGSVDAILFGALQALGLQWPAVVIGPVSGKVLFHDAEVRLPPDQLEQLSYSLDAAVSRFLRRTIRPLPDGWKLPNRLQGRLGYLGVYYKRDPSRFLRNLPAGERSDLLGSLTRTYRDLLISYFKDPAAANQAIESFVNTAFFADLPITRTVEIHMVLIEEIRKQLMLKGQKNDFLQDYRLALLDVMAHLCEMYRRSVPPDLPVVSGALPESHSPSTSPLP
ncbi:circadian clock protein KaiA [Synechococcus sp. CCY 9618]|uniref:circadian clock protein KaiA n=1 Tax=Synechococcus sp. CCY 9618 TaxID=2815602 RepID=UPI001C22228C|nr:circadian clock protein KaiA [Synechococcus sp. CCY 9618]